MGDCDLEIEITQHPHRKEEEYGEFKFESPWSPIGENVLDPFVGSGTTCIAAIKNRRKSIGIELNPKYIKLINKNVQDVIEKTGKNWRWESSIT